MRASTVPAAHTAEERIARLLHTCAYDEVMRALAAREVDADCVERVALQQGLQSTSICAVVRFGKREHEHINVKKVRVYRRKTSARVREIQNPS